MAVSRQDTTSSTAEAFEAITEEVSPSYVVVVDLAGVGLSLVNKKMVEVSYLLMDSIKFEYTNSPIDQSINLSCGNLQIDNQLHEALYPVILQPTPISKEASAVGALPTVQASIIWLKDQGWVICHSVCLELTSSLEHGVLFIKYCSVLLQALTIEADEDLLFAIYDLTKIKGISWEDGTAE
jgi:vacuolar protein sorting-associated protein 13A/C